MNTSLFRHIPNILTVARLCLAFVYPFAPPSFRLSMILISLTTEYFDGALSRWFDWRSRIGSLLDPIADKTFVLVVAFIMFFESDLNWWQFLGIGAREIIVFLGAVKVATDKNWKAFLHVTPRMTGKIATVFQFSLLISHVWSGSIHPYLLYSTILASFIAGMDYLTLMIKNDFYRDYLNK